MTKSNTKPSAAVEFAHYLHGLDEQERKNTMVRVKALVKNADANSGNLKPPALLSTQEYAEQHALHVSQTHEAIIGLGYGENLHRLGGTNSNATECREAVAKTLQLEHGFQSEYSATLIEQIVWNCDAGPFDVLDPCKPELQRPSFLVDGLFYKSKMHMLFGREGTNKTMLIIWTLATLASEGKQVLLIEYEVDEDAVGVQLEEMGFDREALRPFFHQIDPKEPFSGDLVDNAALRFPGCEAVALDNVAEAIASAGGGSNGEENSARDALIVLAPLRDLAHSENGPAVIAVDHLPHARDNAARGSTAKGGLIDVGFQVETPHPVTRTQAGDIKLTCRKDRPSLIGKSTEVWFAVGDGAGNLPIKQIETPGNISDDLTEDGASMILALEQYAKQNPGNEWLSERKVFETCGLPKSRKRSSEMQRLANDDKSPIERQTRPRGNASATTLYRFREVEDYAAGLSL